VRAGSRVAEAAEAGTDDFGRRTSDVRENRSQSLVITEELAVRWLAVLVYLVGAILVASFIGNQQVGLLLFTSAAVVVALVAGGLRQRAWVLVILGWTFSSNTELLRLPFSIRDITVMLAVCAYFGHRVMTKRHIRLPATALDWLLALNVAWLVVTFSMHPVGFRAIGSETVGGRPYLNACIALLAFWLIPRMPDTVKTVSRIPYYMLWAAALLSLLHIVVYVFPAVTPVLYYMYSGLDLDVYYRSVTSLESLMRFKGLTHFGLALVLVLCSYHTPYTLFNPLRLRLYGLLLGLGCILASGYRSHLLWALAALALAAWLHKRWREFVVAASLAGLLVAALVAGQGRLYELPLPAQRTLSFLPARWSPLVAADAQGSTEGRISWWQDIIRYGLIENWWFGDGFGAKARDLQAAVFRGSQEEFIFLTGAYHNGPLTTIRYVGIVGLVLFYALMIATAVYSVRCVNRCRGSPLYPLSVFVAVQAVWTPIHFTFVFGGYDGSLPQQIFLLALLRLIMRMTDERQLAHAPSAATSPAMTGGPQTSRATA
jgi:hypothetical protein